MKTSNKFSDHNVDKEYSKSLKYAIFFILCVFLIFGIVVIKIESLNKEKITMQAYSCDVPKKVGDINSASEERCGKFFDNDSYKDNFRNLRIDDYSNEVVVYSKFKVNFVEIKIEFYTRVNDSKTHVCPDCLKKILEKSLK